MRLFRAILELKVILRCKMYFLTWVLIIPKVVELCQLLCKRTQLVVFTTFRHEVLMASKNRLLYLSWIINRCVLFDLVRFETIRKLIIQRHWFSHVFKSILALLTSSHEVSSTLNKMNWHNLTWSTWISCPRGLLLVNFWKEPWLRIWCTSENAVCVK